MNELVGEVSVPSGTLLIFDVGTLAIVVEPPTVRVEGLPRDRPLRVVGERMGEGDFADSWRSLSVMVSDAPPVRREPLGEVLVDFARVLFADASIHQHWKHDEALDGLADFLFWGKDAASLAAEVGAPASGQGTFGWVDQPHGELLDRARHIEALVARRGFKLAQDFRPHSHHHAALAIARASPTGSATLSVGPLTVCLAFTSWGDGIFPVEVGLDGGGTVARVSLLLDVG